MKYDVIERQPIIEALFASYAPVLGKNQEGYKNHVYRIFNYCMYMSNGQCEEKYAIASVFHDIGIWTHNTFDYLKPSVELASAYLLHSNKKEWMEEISRMIDNHHKVTRYTGDYADTVEIFRKADWADVSMSFIPFDIPDDIIKQTEAVFPYKGFHLTLVSLFARNLIQHPLKPLPMFRK